MLNSSIIPVELSFLHWQRCIHIYERTLMHRLRYRANVAKVADTAH